jgi:valyl-tRNA synthetase
VELKAWTDSSAREKVIEKFEELGLLEKIDDYEIVSADLRALQKSHRAASVRNSGFAKWTRCATGSGFDTRGRLAAILAAGSARKGLHGWLENLKDWTISRQLWWGTSNSGLVRCGRKRLRRANAEEAAEKAGSANLTQDADVLDTGFRPRFGFFDFGWDGQVTETEDLKTYCRPMCW